MPPSLPTLASRTARVTHTLTLVASWGWEHDPTLASLTEVDEHWWLPSTPWRLRCTPHACTIYRLRAKRRPTHTKTYPVSALGDIRKRLAQIQDVVAREEDAG